MSTASAILDDLLSSPAAVEITLGGLSAAAAGHLLAETIGANPDDAFVAASHGATGGNPFLLTELARSLRDQGVAPVASQTTHIDELAPKSVVRRVAAQLRRLGPDAEALATAAAVLGLECEMRHAAALADLDDHATAEAADALYACGVLADANPIVFNHAVVRAAILSLIPPARLATQHGRAARLLRRDGATAERVAAHLIRTPPAADAEVIGTLVQAADAALHHGDADASARYLERALQEAAAAPPAWELLHRLGTACAVGGRPDAVEHLRAAYAACPEDQKPRVALALGDVLARGAHRDEAYELLTSAVEAVGDSDRALRCQLETVLLTHSQIDVSLVPKVRPRLEALRQLPGELPEERVLLAVVAYVTGMQGGDAGVVTALAERAMSGAGSTTRGAGAAGASTPTEWRAYGLLSRTFATLGDTERAQQILDSIFEVAAERGSVETHLLGLVAQAALSYTVGDITAAADDVNAVIAASIDAGSTAALPLAAGMRAATAIELGDHEGALTWLGNLGLLGPLPEVGILDAPLYFRGLLRAEHGDLDAGLEDLLELGRREARSGHHAIFTPWRVGAAAVLARTGRNDEARPLIEEELQSARDRNITWVVGAALRVKGIVDGAAGIASLEEAVEVLAPTPFRLERARAHVDLGAALRRGNRRGDARGHLDTGLELATRCGSVTLIERASAELAAAGARPRRVYVTGPESLTAAERRVADFAAAGRSNPEIAQALFVSRKTVETHLSRVYQKLHIATRAEIAAALAG